MPSTTKFQELRPQQGVVSNPGASKAAQAEAFADSAKSAIGFTDKLVRDRKQRQSEEDFGRLIGTTAEIESGEKTTADLQSEILERFGGLKETNPRRVAAEQYFEKLKNAEASGNLTPDRINTLVETYINQRINQAPGFKDEILAAAQSTLGSTFRGAAFRETVQNVTSQERELTPVGQGMYLEDFGQAIQDQTRAMAYFQRIDIPSAFAQQANLMSEEAALSSLKAKSETRQLNSQESLDRARLGLKSLHGDVTGLVLEGVSAGVPIPDIQNSIDQLIAEEVAESYRFGDNGSKYRQDLADMKTSVDSVLATNDPIFIAEYNKNLTEAVVSERMTTPEYLAFHMIFPDPKIASEYAGVMLSGLENPEVFNNLRDPATRGAVNLMSDMELFKTATTNLMAGVSDPTPGIRALSAAFTNMATDPRVRPEHLVPALKAASGSAKGSIPSILNAFKNKHAQRKLIQNQSLAKSFSTVYENELANIRNYLLNLQSSGQGTLSIDQGQFVWDSTRTVSGGEQRLRAREGQEPLPSVNNLEERSINKTINALNNTMLPLYNQLSISGVLGQSIDFNSLFLSEEQSSEE